MLRVSTVVRSVTSQLGVKFPDRLRINATYALRGLAASRSSGTVGDASDAVFASFRYRMGIRSRVWLIQGLVAFNTAMSRGLLAMMYVFGQPVVLM